MVIPQKCMVSKIQKDLLGIALKWGSPILAETYAVLQMKMIRNPPLIHQGFIGYDAISQNIREKPGFCTLQGPLSGPLRGRAWGDFQPPEAPGILRWLDIPRAEDQRAHGSRLPRRSTVDAGNAGQTRCHLMGGRLSGTSPMVTVDWGKTFAK